MTEKEKLETQLKLFELQLQELRDTPVKLRPINYEDQLFNIAKYIKKLKAELQKFN